jgi:glycosyltransferase involved in cell wall biosynthesis
LLIAVEVLKCRDTEALAARIVQLLKDAALRRRMGSAGLDRARRLFTVERMVQETADAYERVTVRLRLQKRDLPA